MEITSPCVPRGCNILHSLPSGSIPRSRSPSITTVSRFSRPSHPSSPFTSFSSSSSSPLWFSKEKRRKFEMTADGDRKDGSSEITIENPGSGRGSEGMRGGKNCIHSNHIRERHRALRNQLNGEKLVVRREIAGRRRMEGVKEREKAMRLRGPPRADCSVKWMKRGKTKRQTAKDGTCSNQGISRYTCIFFFQLFLSLHLFRL